MTVIKGLFTWLVSKLGEPLSYVALAIGGIAVFLLMGPFVKTLLYILVAIAIVLFFTNDEYFGKIASFVKDKVSKLFK